MENNIDIKFGDISLPNVIDAKDFADNVEQTIRNAMCKDGKTTRCVTEVVSSKLLGKGIGSGRLYR